MKYLLYTLLLFVSLNTATANSIDDIKNAIKQGNSVALAAFFDENVEICILENEDLYTTEGGESVIKEFFAKHKPKTLNHLHKGNSKSNSAQYLTGTMVDTDGNEFRIYIYLKQVGDKSLIQELRFDSGN